MAGFEGEGTSLEFTPTWVFATVCTVMVSVSLTLERLLHYAGKKLKKEGRKALFQALQKVKEELMLLGFVSLLLSVCQSRIVRICVNEDIMKHFLPCDLNSKSNPYTHRQLLESNESPVAICARQNKVPLLSPEALHHLHIFIFVLAIVHVTSTALTLVFGGAKKSFSKQFYGSVTKSDYTALRLGFIMTHCRGNRKFNFHKYMVRALEDDFRKVVGISWYLWIFVVIFLLLNINGWHTYFWIAFIPLMLLLAVGTKLEHVIIQLAHEVAERHIAIEGELVVRPSDHHFWFHRPKMVRYFIHFILFQNAFEIAFFFWMLVQFGPDSCIMGRLVYIIPRLVIGAFIQVLCSYSTLPLYALVTQMGSSFKKSMFDEHVQVSLINWAQKAKRKKALNATSNHTGPDGSGGGGSGGDDVHQRDRGGDAELQGIHIATDSHQ